MAQTNSNVARNGVAPQAGRRAGELGAAVGIGAVGLAAAAVATQGAVALPLMAMDAVHHVSLAGYDVSAGMGPAVVAGLCLVALPAAKAALGQIPGIIGGKGMWDKALDSPTAQRALALSEKLGGLRGAAEVVATSALGMAAAMGASAAGMPQALAMGAMMAAGAAALMGAGGLDRLRQARQARMEKVAAPGEAASPPKLR